MQCTKKVIIITVGVILLVALIVGIVLGCTLGKSKDGDKKKSKSSWRDVLQKAKTGYQKGKKVVDKAKHVYDFASTDVKIPIAKSDVTFYLYTQKNKDVPLEIKYQNVSVLANSNFDPTKKSLFVVHGWHNNYKSEVGQEIKDATLEKHDMNVFVTDWSRVASHPYGLAKNRVVSVGEMVAAFVNRIQTTYNLGGDLFILVGHSLGAHVVGNAGRLVQNQISYIVGLDPAGPLFNSTKETVRLSTASAKYVQVIHTNMDMLGMSKAIGHVDFYPNGGRFQSGCPVIAASANDAGCSHSRSYFFFAESIRRGAVFRAVKCESFFKWSSGMCKGNSEAFMGQLEPNTKNQNLPVGQNEIGKWTKQGGPKDWFGHLGLDLNKTKIINHSHRSSAVTQLAKSGVGEQQLSKITGYSSANSIKPYLQLDEEHHANVINNLRGHTVFVFVSRKLLNYVQ